jgi:membrane protease YdiL (CAAX protease family)
VTLSVAYKSGLIYRRFRGACLNLRQKQCLRPSDRPAPRTLLPLEDGSKAFSSSPWCWPPSCSLPSLCSLALLQSRGGRRFTGVPAKLPTAASTRLYGMLAYAVSCWIAVAAVWLWSSRQGLRSDVFAFERMSRSGLIASVATFIVAMYGVPAVTHWLTYLTGGRSQDVRINFHDAQSVLTYIFLFVITAPVCEEILYRGLLVAWLRRAGWKASTILMAGSLLFGANHYLPLGSLVWSGAMVGLGAILYALRWRTGNSRFEVGSRQLCGPKLLRLSVSHFDPKPTFRLNSSEVNQIFDDGRTNDGPVFGTKEAAPLGALRSGRSPGSQARVSFAQAARLAARLRTSCQD